MLDLMSLLAPLIWLIFAGTFHYTIIQPLSLHHCSYLSSLFRWMLRTIGGALWPALSFPGLMLSLLFSYAIFLLSHFFLWSLISTSSPTLLSFCKHHYLLLCLLRTFVLCSDHGWLPLSPFHPQLCSAPKFFGFLSHILCVFSFWSWLSCMVFHICPVLFPCPHPFSPHVFSILIVQLSPARFLPTAPCSSLPVLAPFVMHNFNLWMWLSLFSSPF